MRKIYFNGKIITLEDTMYADYIVIEDGKIMKVGQGDIPKIDAEYIDLYGNILMPAFIDSHSHFASVASTLMSVSLDEVDTVEEIKKRIKEYISNNQIESGLVTAVNYDNNLLEGAKNIAEKDLNDISLEIGIAVEHKSGHSGIFNSKAQKILGITNSSDGLLEETDYISAIKKIPMPTGETLKAAFSKAQNIYLQNGITTAQEGLMIGELMPMYMMLLGNDMLKVDVIGYPDFRSIEKFMAEFPNSNLKYDKGFKIGGLKILLDGSPQIKTAWVREPYVGGENGYSSLSDEELIKELEFAKSRGMQVLAHCNGDMACEQYINAVSKVGNKNAVMIHSQLLGLDQLDRVKKNGMIPSFFVAHVYHWGDVHIKNLGMERAKNISPAKSAKEKEILFTFHQDSPVVMPNMLETIWCAVNRETKAGIKLGEDQRVDVMTALKAVTINAAYQYGEENTKGSIKAGKNADFVILDKNLFKVDKEKIRDIKVLETIKDGESLYKL